MSKPGSSRWYRVLPKHWKYEVEEEQAVYVPELAGHYAEIRDQRTGKLLAELENGWLFGFPGYRWDGASGPAIDRGLMLPSLFHDILYQMIREGLLEPKRWARRVADRTMRKVSQADGVSWLRRWVDWTGVRAGGWRAVRPTG